MVDHGADPARAFAGPTNMNGKRRLLDPGTESNPEKQARAEFSEVAAERNEMKWMLWQPSSEVHTQSMRIAWATLILAPQILNRMITSWCWLPTDVEIVRKLVALMGIRSPRCRLVDLEPCKTAVETSFWEFFSGMQVLSASRKRRWMLLCKSFLCLQPTGYRQVHFFQISSRVCARRKIN